MGREGVAAVALVAVVAMGALGPGIGAVPNPELCTNTSPANDCFKNAIVVGTRTFHDTAADAQATVEQGEPLGPDMANTVWWKFTATGNMSGSFSVSESDHQAGHVVYELQPDGALQFLDAASGWSGNPWTDFDCVKGRTYYVQAGGEEGQTGTLDLYGSACLPVPPPAPVLTAAPGDARGEVRLTYAPTGDGGGDILAWAIQDAGPSCTGFILLNTTFGDVTTYVDRGLPEGEARCYRVAAVNQAGQGAWSAAKTTAPRGAPSVPRQVQGTAGDGAIHLQHLVPAYDGGSPVTRFRVYAAGAAEGPFELLLEPTGTTSTERGLGDGVTRHYRITAVNALGESAAATASARTWKAPSPPRNFEASWDFPLGVELSWDAPADPGGLPITEYLILRGPHGGALSPYDSVGGTTLEYRDAPSLLRAYDYAVRAVNAKGPSANSAVDCGQSVPLPALPLVEDCYED